MNGYHIRKKKSLQVINITVNEYCPSGIIQYEISQKDFSGMYPYYSGRDYYFNLNNNLSLKLKGFRFEEKKNDFGFSEYKILIRVGE